MLNFVTSDVVRGDKITLSEGTKLRNKYKIDILYLFHNFVGSKLHLVFSLKFISKKKQSEFFIFFCLRQKNIKLHCQMEQNMTYFFI